MLVEETEANGKVLWGQPFGSCAALAGGRPGILSATEKKKWTGKIWRIFFILEFLQQDSFHGNLVSRNEEIIIISDDFFSSNYDCVKALQLHRLEKKQKQNIFCHYKIGSVWTEGFVEIRAKRNKIFGTFELCFNAPCAEILKSFKKTVDFIGFQERFFLWK